MLEKIKDWTKQKAKAVKDKVAIGVWKARQWAKEHPEQAAAVIASVAGATGIVVKRIDQEVKLNREEALKDRRIYDRSLGKFWYLKRRPTTAESLKIERMKKSGMCYGDILSSMDLLK